MSKNSKISKMASELGKIGGKNSVKSRFFGKSKEEISEIMSNVRKSNLKNKVIK